MNICDDDVNDYKTDTIFFAVKNFNSSNKRVS